MALVMPTYAPQRHKLPLMRSLISATDNSGIPCMFCDTADGSPASNSWSMPTAEHSCPGVQYPH